MMKVDLLWYLVDKLLSFFVKAGFWVMFLGFVWLGGLALNGAIIYGIPAAQEAIAWVDTIPDDEQWVIAAKVLIFGYAAQFAWVSIRRS